MPDVAQIQIKLVFDLRRTQFTSAPRTPFEVLIESMFWKALLAPAMRKRTGFLGVAGVAMIPTTDLQPDVFRTQIQDRLEHVLKYFFKQASSDYDTVTGKTKYGPFKFGLTLGQKLDIVQKRLNADLRRLKRIVDKEVVLIAGDGSDESEKERFKTSDPQATIAAIFETLPDDYEGITSKLDSLSLAFRRALGSHFQAAFNRRLYDLLIEKPANTHSAKKEIAAWIRHELDRFGLSLRHPDNGLPCNLITLPGYDSNGVFVLESRESRKRTHTTTDLHSLMDFALIDAATAKSTPNRGKGGRGASIS